MGTFGSGSSVLKVFQTFALAKSIRLLRVLRDARMARAVPPGHCVAMNETDHRALRERVALDHSQRERVNIHRGWMSGRRRA